MLDSLAPGLRAEITVEVVEQLTVPAMSPYYPNFTGMPRVFATAFMVGFLESACMAAIADHLSPGEGSVGITVDVSHDAPTVVGAVARAEAELVAVDKRILSFEVNLFDEAGRIGGGRHQRAVIDLERFPVKAQQRFDSAS